MAALRARWAAALEWVNTLKPTRVLAHDLAMRGPILAAGLAYQAFFAVFAALWAGFSIAGVVISADLALQRAILSTLADAVPGLIDTGSGGAIDPGALLSTPAFTLSGVVALVGLLATALGWLAASRDAARAVIGLPPAATNVVVARLIDLVAGLLFAALVALAAVLSVIGTAATENLLAWIGADPRSGIVLAGGRLASVAVSIAFSGSAIAVLFRVVARVRVPWPILGGAALVGGFGITGVTVASGLLLGGATANPLIAPFAVIAGLLIVYNLVCQVFLLSASWIAVTAGDAGLDLAAASAGAGSLAG